jgi:hypothetical protein
VSQDPLWEMANFFRKFCVDKKYTRDTSQSHTFRGNKLEPRPSHRIPLVTSSSHLIPPYRELRNALDRNPVNQSPSETSTKITGDIVIISDIMYKNPWSNSVVPNSIIWSPPFPAQQLTLHYPYTTTKPFYAVYRLSRALV